MNEDYSRSPSIHKYTPVIGWIIKNGNSCLTGGSGECVSERMNEWRWDERAKKNQCKVAKEKPANLVFKRDFYGWRHPRHKISRNSSWSELLFPNLVPHCRRFLWTENKAHNYTMRKKSRGECKKKFFRVNGNWYLGDQ